MENSDNIKKAKAREYLRQWRSKNPDKVAEHRKRASRKRSEMRRYKYATDKKYRDSVAAAAKARYKRLRDEMFAAYGNSCTCCGEKCREFLTLEHLIPRVRGQYRGSGTGEHSRLSRAGWPAGEATVMCMNCNHARGRLGECQHVLAVKNLTES